MQETGDDQVIVVGRLDALQKGSPAKDVATDHRHEQCMFEIVIEGVASTDAFDRDARQTRQALSFFRVG